jgi:hypothetical protein
MSMLSWESQHVIGLRLMTLALGGRRARDESMLMISEKVDENMRAMHTLMSGGSPEDVIAGYRKRVAANARRLGRGR